MTVLGRKAQSRRAASIKNSKRPKYKFIIFGKHVKPECKQITKLLHLLGASNLY